MTCPIRTAYFWCIWDVAGCTAGQVSWRGDLWRKELADPEKGFYGWFCNRLKLPDCSPYQVRRSPPSMPSIGSFIPSLAALLTLAQVVILTAGGPEDPGTLTSVI